MPSHRQVNTTRGRLALVAVLVAALVAVGTGLVLLRPGGSATSDDRAAAATSAPPASSGSGSATPRSSSRGDRAAGAAPPASPFTRDRVALARSITDTVDGWASFSAIDKVSGARVGDRRASQTNNTESVIKTWLAADLLLAVQRRERPPLSPAESALLVRMIRNSDDDAAQTIYRQLGGDASIEHMIKLCGMTDTTIYSGWWSLTQMSSRDMVRLGQCIEPGRHLDRGNAGWLLALMRTVSPDGSFGIQRAMPAGRGVRVAIKNGWTMHSGTGLWNVNCLATWGPGLRYVLAVETRYPIPRGLAYGARTCEKVTTTLFAAKPTGRPM